MWISFVIETRQEFQEKIGGAFEHPMELGDRTVEELWIDFHQESARKGERHAQSI